MSKTVSLRKHIILVQSVVALIVVLGYSLLLNWYFSRGLSEANAMSMYIESKAFADSYNEGQIPALSRSIDMTGYIGWQAIPSSIKDQFPSMKHISKFEIKNNHIISKKGDKGYPGPGQVNLLSARPLSDGKVFYLFYQINLGLHSHYAKKRLLSTIISTWPFALAFLLLMLGSVHLMFKQLTKPLRDLRYWSDNLTLDDVRKNAPDFGFKELNNIAAQQQHAFTRIGEMLEKDRDFLRHASHEIRTPIAVVKSNSELLGRILENNKGIASVDRIKRAVLNMENITETLLWLSRDDRGQANIALKEKCVDVSTMLVHLVEDNRYLLQNKLVNVKLNLEPISIKLAESPFRLCLNNLIRNAFQYTVEGEVLISLTADQIIITNINRTEEDIDYSGADYGYGLGLLLVDRIVKITGWKYQNIEVHGGRQAIFDFKLVTLKT